MTQSSDEPVRTFKVVDIFNDRELAINGGLEDGISEGTIFRIVEKTPQKITDPDTGELLGEIVRMKAVVRVFEVQERFCLARTFRSRQVNVGGQTGLGKFFDPPKWETRVETLRRAEGVGKPLPAAEALVNVGDIAEIITGKVDDLPSLSAWR